MPENKVVVRTRFAPSPTGSMHIGNLRSALYAYLLARHYGGTFILRIEDTDRDRHVKEAEKAIYRTLKQAGLGYDEGPDIGGPHGPYIQSERLATYRPLAESLIESGHAYRCFCTKERLESLRSEKNQFGYDNHCRHLSEAEIAEKLAAGLPYVIRQKMPTEGETSFTDEVYGTITIDNSELEDQILIKSDGYPTYNFANVVDDHDMEITHVLRGSEYLSSTPKYNLIYEAFGWDLPVYVHLPLILGEDGGKLSKRHGATSFEALLAEGYLADAIINYIAFLGFAPADETREIFSLDELAERFVSSCISKSPATFSYDKLRWFNEQYIRAMDPKQFGGRIRFLMDKAMGRKDYDRELLASLLQPRVATFGEIADKIRFFSEPGELSEELFTLKRAKLKPEIAAEILNELTPQLKATDYSQDALHEAIGLYMEASGRSMGQVMGALRLAASGEKVTPGGAVEILYLLGRDEASRRLELAAAFLGGEAATQEPADEQETVSKNFIEVEIDRDLARPDGPKRVHTRFPPEPNGYLHIGHAKALIINYGIAERYDGLYNLRMDDTNPEKEEVEYVEAIKDDIRWLGFDWGDRFFYASDFFAEMYDFAVELIEKGLAYVDEQDAETIRRQRGTLTTPGENSPFRDRPKAESLDLFARMKAGEFKEGAMVLRARIDMASGNMNMRDPVIYRILHQAHHRTGTDWVIYPMYDFAHPIEDALEKITHSLCSIEFEDHRPLYDWVIDNISIESRPRQIEFARLGLSHTVMSKRKLRALVEDGLVEGWDDPRLPTLRGMRRRGFTPKAIRNFAERIGVSKVPNMVDDRFLEFNVREDLNERAPRAMAVLDPIELIIEDYEDGREEIFLQKNWPDRDETHEMTFSKTLWIERDDFAVEPPKGYKRLSPGASVRLINAYVVTATRFETDEDGNVTKVFVSHDRDSRGRDSAKNLGAIHWVDQKTCFDAEVYLYERLFFEEDPDSSDLPYDQQLNPDSVRIMPRAKLERWLLDHESDVGYQFLRDGYFVRDSHNDERPAGKPPRYNRSVPLRDSYKPAF